MVSAEESDVQKHGLLFLSTSITILANAVYYYLTSIYKYLIGQHINTSFLWFC